MLKLRRPSPADIDRYLAAQAPTSFSYAAVGATAGAIPAQFAVDRNCVRLGAGRATFQVAAAALRRWEMFDIGWAGIRADKAPPGPGTNVAVVAHHFGVWWLNACRVVYVVEEGTTRFALAYGTLSDHAESGEERFSVERRAEDDSVWYDILAFSRPRHPLARVGRPFARALQRRFAQDSLKAMQRAVTTPA